MNATSLLLAIIGHLVGDYLLQNDWMALNKKKPGSLGTKTCAVHSFIWAQSVVIFAGWGWPWGNPSPAIAILFVLHYIQDRTNIITRWMDFIGQKQFRTGPCAPWSSIVVDNVWHIVTLWAVWRFVV
jgi:hypothetical protein